MIDNIMEQLNALQSHLGPSRESLDEDDAVGWDQVEDAKDELNRVRGVCAEAYQMAGALHAPVKALDNLSAAANGRAIPHETFLPVTVRAMAPRCAD